MKSRPVKMPPAPQQRLVRSLAAVAALVAGMLHEPLPQGKRSGFAIPRSRQKEKELVRRRAKNAVAKISRKRNRKP